MEATWTEGKAMGFCKHLLWQAALLGGLPHRARRQDGRREDMQICADTAHTQAQTRSSPQILLQVSPSHLQMCQHPILHPAPLPGFSSDTPSTFFARLAHCPRHVRVV